MDFQVGDLVKVVMECDACDDRKIGLPCRYLGRVGRIHHVWSGISFYIVDFIEDPAYHRYLSFGVPALEHWNGLETVFELVP